MIVQRETRILAKAVSVSCVAAKESPEPDQIANAALSLKQSDVNTLVLKTTQHSKET